MISEETSISRKALRSFFPLMTYAVYRDEYRWVAQDLTVGVTHSRGLRDAIRHATAFNMTPTLIFRNEAAIAEFLATPAPFFADLRAFVSRARRNRSFSLLTRDEVLELAGMDGELVDRTPQMGWKDRMAQNDSKAAVRPPRDWKAELIECEVDIPFRTPNGFKALSLWSHQGLWCLQCLFDHESYAYSFDREAQWLAAVLEAGRGGPTLLAGTRMIATDQGVEETSSLNGPLDEYSIIVPDNPSHPVLRVRPHEIGVTQNDVRNQAEAGASYPVTVFAAEPPPQYEFCLCDPDPKEPASPRAMPFDVLAANQGAPSPSR